MPCIEAFSDEVAALRRALDSAEAVVIGAGAGLSTAAGFTYAGPRFRENFSEFEARYGFHDMYTGGFYTYPSPEEHWAFWSRNILLNRYQDPPFPVYDRLLRLMENRDYFVLTTNVDHCFQRAGFEKQRLFYTQGDYGLFQCSLPCHQKTYDNETAVRRMVAEQRGLRIPSELVPRCPVCGRPMGMNLRADDTFVEDEGWHRAAQRYQNFLRHHEGKRVLYLELGVGYNTPAIIKFPFWRLTAANPSAFYACINLGETACPPVLRERSLCIDGDIAEVLMHLETP